MEIEELERELKARLAELSEMSANPEVTPAHRAEIALTLAYYLTEVVKRWRSQGITLEMVQQYAAKATERRIRTEKAQEFLALMERIEQGGGFDGQAGENDQGEAEGPEGDGTRGVDAFEEGVDHPRRARKAPRAGSKKKRVGATGGNRAGRPAPRRADPGTPESDGQDADRGVGAGRFEGTSCPSCGAGMPPQVEGSKPLVICPGCGWKPSGSAPKAKRPIEAPQTGRSFSDGFARKPRSDD